MNERRNHVENMIKLINECGDALNTLDHKKAANLLDQFDKEFSGNEMPIDIIYHRLILGAELSSRIGQKNKAIDEIVKNLALFTTRPDYRFKLLLKAGRLEASLNRVKISTKFITEALGMAEELQDNNMIAEAYAAIAQMFAPKYYGLALYFSRKAELAESKTKRNHNLKLLKIERALISHIVFLNNRANSAYLLLEREAIRLIDSINISDFNPHERRRFRYVNGFINADEEELESILSEIEDIIAFPLKSQIEEIYIGICLEKGLFEKAEKMLVRYRYDAITFHDSSETLLAHIKQLQRIIENKVKSCYIPFGIRKSDDERTTLFDILDKYSLTDELWALEEGPLRQLFPSYEQEGKFEAIAMRNGEVRLFPCGLAFNVYYRGQAEYHSNSFPTIYRNGMTKAKRLVERIRYEELKRCVEDYPLTELFRSDIYCIMPDGNRVLTPLSIDHLALAQHYGIKTELLDLTSDKFVAAFFASTYCVNDIYYPIIEEQKEPGVFYKYSDNSYFNISGEISKLRVVGLQPFSRPGEQAGLVYEMQENENFNSIATSKEFFFHDKDVSEFIFNYTNRSEKLFPEGPLKLHADSIKNATVLSKTAFKMAKEDYYPDTDTSELLSWLENEGITLSDDVNYMFTEEEKMSCLDEWRRVGCREMLDKIIVRPILKC